jgi:hypothetical protein
MKQLEQIDGDPDVLVFSTANGDAVECHPIRVLHQEWHHGEPGSTLCVEIDRNIVVEEQNRRLMEVCTSCGTARLYYTRDPDPMNCCRV